MGRSAASRNLVLIADANRLDIKDFIEIGQLVTSMDPSTLVYVGTPEDDENFVPPHRWQFPTLTVAFGKLGKFRPQRGRVFFNRLVTKWRQYELLTEARIKVPRTEMYRPLLDFDPALWGRHVIVKPSGLKETSGGNSGLVLSTAALQRRDGLPEQAEALLGRDDTLVQEYVPTGPFPTSYRVGTLLGRVIHMMRKSSSARAPDLTDPDFVWAYADSNHESPEDGERAGRELVSDPDIMALGVKVSHVFDGLTLLGIDILRHETTGELYVLEINGGGNTWQFSSRHAAPGRLVISKEDRMKQFDAWKTCAKRLLEVTQRQAK